MKKNRLLLGAHVSISNGIENVFERGESIGCTAMQIFTKNNRQWHAKELEENTINLFKEKAKESSIKDIIVHATYLINIGSSDPQINKKSTDSLINELKRCKSLGLKYLVLHPGSYQKSTESDCLKIISEKLNAVFEQVPDVSILVENMAGMGTSVGYNFEQLATIREKVEFKNRIGFCFDTCHAFAAGYDFSTPESYEQMWKNFDSILGISNLKAIHLNDSKKDLSTYVDRHEFISKGKIETKAFELLINDERFFDVPKILETPVETFKDYEKDLATLVNLISENNKFLVENTLLEKYLIKKERD